jgi:hypothetical protein
MPSVADVLRRYGEEYLEQFAAKMPAEHKKVLHAITACRTGVAQRLSKGAALRLPEPQQPTLDQGRALAGHVALRVNLRIAGQPAPTGAQPTADPLRRMRGADARAHVAATPPPGLLRHQLTDDQPTSARKSPPSYFATPRSADAARHARLPSTWTIIPRQSRLRFLGEAPAPRPPSTPHPPSRPPCLVIADPRVTFLPSNRFPKSCCRLPAQRAS